MIILEGEEDQIPKLPTDPIDASSSTHRPLPPLPPPHTLARPPSPNPTLPDYETSEAQHLLQFRRGNKGPRGRHICKLVWYAAALYSALFVVVGIPWMALRHRRQWHNDPLFDYTNPTSPGLPQTHGPLPESDSQVLECDQWSEHKPLPGSSSQEGSASLRLGIREGDAIVLRANATASQWRDLVSGRLSVEVNPDATEMSSMLYVTAAWTDRSLFRDTLVCRTQTSTASRITISVPNRTHDISEDAHLYFDIKLLLPVSPNPVFIEALSTYLPYFEQNFGRLAPNVTFGSLLIEGLSSKISFGAIKAATLLVKTSDAEISGTFNVSESLTLDTINAPIFADVTMMHDERNSQPMTLIMETGNSPIVANFSLLVKERFFGFHRPHTNFVAKARTFNAPVNLSVTHLSRSASLGLRVQSTQGPVNVSLDAPYVGTFDLQAKSALATLEERPVWGSAATFADVEDEERVVVYDYVSSDRLLGWVGWGHPPVKRRERRSHVEIVSSLSPASLHLDKSRTITDVRRR